MDKEKTRLTIDGVPPDLKRRFRVWCINHNTTMTEMILKWIFELLEAEKQKK